MMLRITGKKRALLPLMISFSLSNQIVFADEKAADYERLEKIEVEGVRTALGGDNINLVDIERINPNDLQDLFRGTPSVQVGSSLPISQKVYVNGIEETNLAVTIDGARQNNKLFHHAGTNLIDPELLKAVRVDAGVAPADAGPGALGGSLAYETKDVSDLLVDGDNFGGAIGLEYNSNGHVFDRNLSLYGRSGGFEALGYIKRATGSEFEDGDNNEVIGSETAFKSGLIKLAYLHDSGYRAKVSFEKVDDDADRPFRANFAGRFTGDALTRQYQLVRETVALSIKDETPVGLFNPYVKIARTETDLATGETDTGAYKSVNGTLANEFVLGMGTVDAGFDFYDDSTKGDFPAFYVVEEKARNYGVFTQARIAPTQQTRVSFGGRYDDHQLEGVEGTNSNNEGWSGNLSGEFDATSFMTFSAGYSHVFGGVQLAEPFITSPTWVYPAGGLKSANAENSYIGLEVKGGGLSSELSGLTLAVKLFKTDINDLRDEEFGGGPDIYSELESDGFEINGRYDWQSGFARVSYADIDVEINGIEGGTEAQYIGTAIGRSVRGDFFHAFDYTGITIGADVQHYFEEDGTDTFSTPMRQQGAFEEYTVVNAFVGYTPLVFQDLTLRATVSNVFDETYVDRASYGQEYTNTFDTQLLNEQGRSLILSAKLRF